MTDPLAGVKKIEVHVEDIDRQQKELWGRAKELEKQGKKKEAIKLRKQYWKLETKKMAIYNKVKAQTKLPEKTRHVIVKVSSPKKVTKEVKPTKNPVYNKEVTKRIRKVKVEAVTENKKRYKVGEGDLEETIEREVLSSKAKKEFGKSVGNKGKKSESIFITAEEYKKMLEEREKPKTFFEKYANFVGEITGVFGSEKVVYDPKANALTLESDVPFLKGAGKGLAEGMFGVTGVIEEAVRTSLQSKLESKPRKEPLHETVTSYGEEHVKFSPIKIPVSEKDMLEIEAMQKQYEAKKSLEQKGEVFGLVVSMTPVIGKGIQKGVEYVFKPQYEVEKDFLPIEVKGKPKVTFIEERAHINIEKPKIKGIVIERKIRVPSRFERFFFKKKPEVLGTSAKFKIERLDFLTGIAEESTKAGKKIITTEWEAGVKGNIIRSKSIAEIKNFGKVEVSSKGVKGFKFIEGTKSSSYSNKLKGFVRSYGLTAGEYSEFEKATEGIKGAGYFKFKSYGLPVEGTKPMIRAKGIGNIVRMSFEDVGFRIPKSMKGIGKTISKGVKTSGLFLKGSSIKQTQKIGKISRVVSGISNMLLDVGAKAGNVLKTKKIIKTTSTFSRLGKALFGVVSLSNIGKISEITKVKLGQRTNLRLNLKQKTKTKTKLDVGLKYITKFKEKVGEGTEYKGKQDTSQEQETLQGQGFKQTTTIGSSSGSTFSFEPGSPSIPDLTPDMPKIDIPTYEPPKIKPIIIKMPKTFSFKPRKRKRGTYSISLQKVDWKALFGFKR